MKGDYIRGLKDKLRPFSKFLGDRKFFASDDVTLVDFRSYELMKVLTIFSSESFQDFPNLVEYVKRFEELPKIKAYMHSDRFDLILFSLPEINSIPWVIFSHNTTREAFKALPF